jgi:hypothetical protein
MLSRSWRRGLKKVALKGEVFCDEKRVVHPLCAPGAL